MANEFEGYVLHEEIEKCFATVWDEGIYSNRTVVCPQQLEKTLLLIDRILDKGVQE